MTTLLAVANAGLLPATQIAYSAPATLHQIEQHAPAQYDFSYSVADPQTGDVKEQHESRQGDNVQGQYSLVEPDGNRRTVQYSADAINGFNAVVHREGATQHVSPVAIAHAAPVAIAKLSHPVAIAHQAPIAYAAQHQISAPIAYTQQHISAAPIAYTQHQVAAPIAYTQHHQVAAAPIAYTQHHVAASPIAYTQSVSPVAIAQRANIAYSAGPIVHSGLATSHATLTHHGLGY